MAKLEAVEALKNEKSEKEVSFPYSKVNSNIEEHPRAL
jgi:hypothetical protein